MFITKIGILKEGRKPIDTRTPITPVGCKKLLNRYPGLEIFVKDSEFRCFTKEEYENAGAIVTNNLSECEILLGVKEVPVAELISSKKYIFFSHTIKKQAHNRPLLKNILSKNIELMDYECLTYDNGTRVIGFGHFAGIVGTHNGLLAWGKKTGKFSLKRAKDCKDFIELKTCYQNFNPGPIKIVLTGSGRVAKGALEMLEVMQIKKVNPTSFLNNNFDEAVFTQLDVKDLYAKKGNNAYEISEFFYDPSEFYSLFSPYTKVCDLMINAIYWNPKAPVFFSSVEAASNDFKIKVIADISCDIKGGIPITIKATSIDNPVFGYNPSNKKITEPYQDSTIDIMSVDNLPNELPRDASDEFSNSLIDHVLDPLIHNGSNSMIKRATITQNGSLTKEFEYLKDFIDNDEKIIT